MILMKLISRGELKEKSEGGSDFKLIMALDDWQYQAKHIPGSLPFSAVTGSQMSKLLHAGIADAVPKILTQLKHDRARAITRNGLF